MGELPVMTPVRPPGARREQCVLPGAPASVPEARRFVRQVLQRWGREEYEEAGTLLVSELVGNGVLHARTELQVELVDGPDGVLLGVTDSSPAMPLLRRHGREAATGRGLWLLEQYSSRHGVDRSPAHGGKQVWAVLRPEAQGAQEGSDAALAMWLDELEGL